MEHTETTTTQSIPIAQESSATHASFISLYDAYFSRVYNYVRYRVGDADSADDLTSVVFEEVLYNFHRYQPDRAPFGAWLFGIARNIVNAHFRLQRNRQTTSLDVLDKQPTENFLPEASLISAETTCELLASLDALNDRERDLLSLKFAARLTNRRIAELTRLSETNVSVMIYRALKKLRRQLAQKE
jgi:RNA polymerase sigma factor (sigma-70 family)